MIDYVKGRLTEISPTHAVVECGGVGYGAAISLNTYDAILGKEEVRLFIHEAIREDAYTLYGFATRDERDLHRLLITVSGVGAASARLILSSYKVQEIVNFICYEDVASLKGIKGIGPKTAQRIVVELKDKAQKMQGVIPAKGKAVTKPGDEGERELLKQIQPASQEQEDALMALEVLGFNRAQAQKALQAVGKETPDLKTGDLVKEAMKILRS